MLSYKVFLINSLFLMTINCATFTRLLKHKNCECITEENCLNSSMNSFQNFISPRHIEQLDNQVEYCPKSTICCPLDYIKTSSSQLQQVNCGIKNKFRKRIVNDDFDEFSQIGDIPWQAAILKKENQVYIYKASGVLVGNKKILSTAHNVVKLNGSDIFVRLGENDVNLDEENGFKHQDNVVKKIILHPDFNEKTLNNDFSVICLKKSVTFNEVILPVCLPDSSELFINQDCTVSGWGKDTKDYGSYSSILKKVSLNVIPKTICEQMLELKTGVEFKLNESFLCAGGKKNKDSCQGDGGSPLTCERKDGSQVLAGLVSWGIGCGEFNVPGIYSNVAYAIDWINSVQCDDTFNDNQSEKNKLNNLNHQKEYLIPPVDDYFKNLFKKFSI